MWRWFAVPAARSVSVTKFAETARCAFAKSAVLRWINRFRGLTNRNHSETVGESRAMAKEKKAKGQEKQEEQRPPEVARHSAKETPRLKARFAKEVAPALMKEFDF